VLASGSGGNCLYVAGGGTRLLVDAGLSRRETAARLAAIGVELGAVDAVLFTHDHEDHCRGAPQLRRRHALPFYANEGTSAGVELVHRGMQAEWRIFETASTFAVGGLRVEAFSVPHDASDAVGFAIVDGCVRLGVVTDLGSVTALVRHKLAACDALVLETNHDVEMLRQSGRPWSLIQRILGPRGHLSNEQAAELLAAVLGPRLRLLVLAHLSAECNTPSLAAAAVRGVLRDAGRADVRVEVAAADAAGALLKV